VATYDQGGHVTYLDPGSSQIGHKESASDTARVLSRMFDAIEFRGKAQSTVEELAAGSGVPVYNGLTDEWHPTQMLADFLTMSEHSDGRPLHQLSYCFMGDGRFNMGRSLLVMGAIMGSDVRICAPEDLWPDKDVQDAARERAEESGARITLTADPEEGLRGADFVHTDVWVSMGEPKEVWSARVRDLTPYQVNADAMARTGNKRAKFMHCLPAFHDTRTTVGSEVAEQTGLTGGLEVTDEVFSSAANIAFDQAENRLHTIKAVMVATIGS
jgi:ornithine carbamoyltransferase